jgi:catechol 2,3-dioxygenase-like lactoylglutathione lyase family enzyme
LRATLASPGVGHYWVMRPTGFHHVAICVNDAEAAKSFYCDVLGFTPVGTRPDDFGPGAWLDAGGPQLHLMEVTEPAANPGHFALRVDDLDAWVSEISAAGVRVDKIPHMPGAGQQAFLHDPSGNVIELNQPD